MSSHLLAPSAIRHHLRALGTRISPFFVSLPNQVVNILLVLPALVFLVLYIYNERQSAHVKTALEFEKVVWPQYFGFPDWYGRPQAPPVSEEAVSPDASSLQAIETPWNPEESRKAVTHEHPRRILCLIRESRSQKACSVSSFHVSASDVKLHEQNVFLHDLQALAATSNDMEVVLRQGDNVEPDASPCWDWLITFGSG